MDLASVMRELESLGTEQNRALYARHGVGPGMFGVGSADQYMLARRIGVDHPLAQELWATGNHDARVLATMVADPAQSGIDVLEGWARDLDNHIVTDALSKLAAQADVGRDRIDEWCASSVEWISQLGWALVGQLTLQASTPDDYFERKLEHIEREIHWRPNRARHEMNQALICIGLHRETLREKALAAAERIGRVHVDHGDTSGETPDAAECIRRSTEKAAPMAAEPAARRTPAMKSGKKSAAAAAKRAAPARKRPRARTARKPARKATKKKARKAKRAPARKTRRRKSAAKKGASRKVAGRGRARGKARKKTGRKRR